MVVIRLDNAASRCRCDTRRKKLAVFCGYILH